jgi:protein-S-isoprenylcysteine O-methyltransferase Ste14
MPNLEHRIPPPIVGLIVGASMYGLAALSGPIEVAPWAKYAVAASLAGIGMSFDVLGLLAFRRARTTVNPLRPERASALVTNGVYRLTRNPMYVGMVFFLLAWATLLAAPLAVLGIPLFVAFISRFQIAPEERVLRARFGEDFERYAAQVRRWL